MKIRVWYTDLQNNRAGTETVTNMKSLIEIATWLYETGGVRDGNAFIPWHRILLLEQLSCD